MPETKHPGFAGVVQYTAEHLPADSDQATARTIERMYQYIREDSDSPIVRSALYEAAHPAMQMSNPRATAMLVFDFIRRRVRFVTDAQNAQKVEAARTFGWKPHEIELLIRPVDLLRMTDAAGDCDDFSMLGAAMLTAAGIPAELVTVAADRENPDQWSHVYVLALVDSQPIAFDASHGRFVGWEYPTPTRKAVWKRTSEAMHLGNLSRDPASALTAAELGLPSASAAPSSIWERIALIGATAAANRYGTTPGIQYKTGPNGQMQYTQYQPQPFLSATFPGLPGGIPGSGGISTSWLLLGGLAIVAVIAISSKG